ncbi:transposase [Rhodococcus artemisiae]|uniref:Transposase n=1 Tax=Rhodococcus artemisiae TaxID=714159 RepID=A0ABU7LC29_9NOCA|nr:transposase [Rhodococcus artemisiae]MEE2059115.1 transposase [Rhodococcus artemisiae]
MLDEPIPVAIETSRGVLVAALRGSGRIVQDINPMAVARYRDRGSMARKKSDHVDAMTLANILRTDAHAHRTRPSGSDLARAITVLARAAQDAIWRRTMATQELRDCLSSAMSMGSVADSVMPLFGVLPHGLGAEG